MDHEASSTYLNLEQHEYVSFSNWEPRHYSSSNSQFKQAVFFSHYLHSIVWDQKICTLGM